MVIMKVLSFIVNVWVVGWVRSGWVELDWIPEMLCALVLMKLNRRLRWDRN